MTSGRTRRVDPAIARAAARLRTVTTSAYGACAFADLLVPVLETLLDVADADIALIQRYGTHHTGPAPRRHLWRARGGAGDNFAITERLSLQHPELYATTANLTLPPVLERRSFVEDQAIWKRDELERSAFFQTVYVPSGIGHQLRLLAYDDTRLVGWVGFLRLRGTSPFQKHDRERLQPLVLPAIAAMVHADRSEAAHAPDVVGDLLLDARGHVDFASVGGRAWLQQPAFLEALRARVAAFDRGDDAAADLLLSRGSARLVRLDGDSGHVRYLVHVTPSSSVSSPLLALTPTQRRVAERAALGMTIESVADEMAITAHTTRSHLKEVYRRLGVSTRVELAALLR